MAEEKVVIVGSIPQDDGTRKGLKSITILVMTADEIKERADLNEANTATAIRNRVLAFHAEKPSKPKQKRKRSG